MAKPIVVVFMFEGASRFPDGVTVGDVISPLRATDIYRYFCSEALLDARSLEIKVKGGRVTEFEVDPDAKYTLMADAEGLRTLQQWARDLPELQMVIRGDGDSGMFDYEKGQQLAREHFEAALPHMLAIVELHPDFGFQVGDALVMPTIVV